ncbi:3'(2'),5'-bisphosphate nucleotidase CysQ [Rhodovastum atsumiense]|uniref:3'(2'),5'-bisphosphate nucleotidase CysQ n=1 Tax=Rhodovastum atsumiense TaxID=504468 RepID=A0A5M6IXB6_9PROT|nr:3'(2'),5'-bisphosphate nucleotidase CysQ [Rhodovastum atsumiense]KAA5612015.1 3'(2'),5'-bisphosphate nucleotidase CysQ [Rhodovastum atsumiense]CAH2604125.1 3'(2'),5'-bisphosphate nucleotidase CysQ [Rhodovastum atsumiense]
MDDAALLALAFDLAAEAGETILAVRRRGFTARQKADRSPVTEADEAAEAIIAAGLRAATPDLPVVAEEAIAAGDVPATADSFWCVDPLDGTREFTAGGDDFAVCIGLVRAGRAVLGVVGAPAKGLLYGGIVGWGAVRRAGGVESPIAARHPPPEGLTVLASRRHGDVARLESFLAGRPVAARVHIGSALKFCLLAEGAADLYPRFGTTMEWDTCAAQAVLEAAGGSVHDGETGAALRYGKPGFVNPHFYATGRT